MKTLLTAGALLLASSQAFSAVIVETASFGTQGSVADQAIGFGLNETVTINAFDSTLGNLTGVNVNVYSQIDSEGQSTNTSGLDGQSQFNFFLTSDWAVTSSVGGATFSGPGVLFSESDLDHQVGEVFDYGHVSEYQSSSIAISDISAFLSDVDFSFVVNALSTFTNTTAGGSAVFENIIDSAAWGKVEVVYTYDAVVTSVPETSSLAILGLGLAGIALSRKAKKSA
ncbi:PEP-CTERM sorting domain-containing protein [Aestuariibacter sp. A3R04]|uniref:PEP-CTERM sorting domain-containing protein n=1 Tax=Aestuariibacter sp. A3R04 TaxID=2841571 RepID=UPI001C0813E4|nr:PEP-CTERM sorting domain-containing protein [Aestuariibacter sp. A3R04]MBU3021011.1 PEP-CTERM sorting domain-containing protein [Aestuariibacter sp. A3R04]